MTQDRYYDIKRDAKHNSVNTVSLLYGLSKATNLNDYKSKCVSNPKTNRRQMLVKKINKMLDSIKQLITKLENDSRKK